MKRPNEMSPLDMARVLLECDPWQVEGKLAEWLKLRVDGVRLYEREQFENAWRSARESVQEEMKRRLRLAFVDAEPTMTREAVYEIIGNLIHEEVEP